MPKLLNIHRDGWPDGAINIMRPGPWGNKFRVGGSYTRQRAVELHKQWVLEHKELWAAIQRELGGHDLLCCCDPKACHGGILLWVANKIEPSDWG